MHVDFVAHSIVRGARRYTVVRVLCLSFGARVVTEVSRRRACAAVSILQLLDCKIMHLLAVTSPRFDSLAEPPLVQLTDVDARSDV